ncbi:MAG: hypothetical protein ACFCU8_09455 [Thermosynechococcaceae cyanobacterium]
MTDLTPEATAVNATEQLLSYYNFQDEVQSRERLLDSWLRAYPVDWVRLALIEALYQGRYKSASVEYLLRLWQRRGQPTPHFGREFERLVTHNCPKTFLSLLQIPREAEAEQKNAQLSHFIDELLVPDAGSSKNSSPSLSPDELDAFLNDSDASEMMGLDSDQPSLDTIFLTQRSQITPLSALEELEELEQQLSGDAAPKESPVVQVNSTTPIHRFKPSSRPSELYTKLAAMANQA